MNMNRLDMCEGDTGDAVCRVEVFDFKGKKSVRLVMYDLRPEPEDYMRFVRESELFSRFARGGAITREEAQMLMPQKCEFIALLRHIKRNCGEEKHMSVRIGSLCRRICREEHLDKTYAKLMVCLEILAEKNRLRYALEDEIADIELLEEKPTNLNTSEMMIRLREALEGPGNKTAEDQIG
jgi:single-stranded-DNA-specific exonuclease